MKRAAIVFIFFSIVFQGYSQWTKPGFEGSFGHGFLWPHRKSMLHLPKESAKYLEIRVHRMGDGSKDWNWIYPDAEVGVSVKAFNLANQDLLGYGIGAAFYFSAPVIKKPRFQWNLEFGAGPGIVTKPFDPIDNYKNIAIGSYGNAFIVLGQRFDFELNDRWYSTLNLSFNHFSNAAFALPNLGLNYPMISLGVGYRVPAAAESQDSEPDTTQTANHFWTVGFSGGLRQYPQPYESRFPAYVGSGSFHYRLGKKASVSLGGDVMQNTALWNYRSELGEEVSLAANTQFGARIGYNLHIGDFMTFLQMGAYVIDGYKGDGSIYNRVGCQYFISENLGVNLSLKTHLFKADYAEIGIVFRI